MTIEAGASTTLIPGAHRVIRSIDSDEGPFKGMLVTNGVGVAVRVDAATFSGWSGWRYAGCEHVVGPLDLIRRTEGHDVLLPWCTERVAAFLARRSAARVPLAAGEVSTLVASLLRGIAECGEATDAAREGAWWLTDGGRPVFVIGAGEDVHLASAALVERMRTECTDRALGRVLSAICEGVADGASRPRLPRMQLERWEVELFEVAAPRVLDREPHPPERAREIGTLREDHITMPARSRRAAREAEDSGSRLERFSPFRAVHALLRSFTERVGAVVTLVSAARPARLTRRRTAPRPPRRYGASGEEKRRPGRRALVTVGAASAAAVLAGGMLWPADEPGESASSEVRVEASPTPGGGAPQNSEPSPSPSGQPNPVGDPDDPVSAASALIELVSACLVTGDMLCSAAVAEGPVGIVEALHDLASADHQPSLAIVDEYGDIAVVRASPAAPSEGEAASSTAEQMLVLVRVNENWLVRDVYGVADQPG